ncbi:sterol desaturase family protein [Spirosoma panaciterrae]|uniref:sterol desaturase family protein n=1 Tax=Spirosoma panaciterrae TaxID=496058 RepID=UPI0003687AA9|nr:sterol desaturase family protein [Spirosoma panaciterrae]
MTEISQLLVDELTGFLGIHHWMEMFRSGDYHSLLTWKGIQAALSPLIPALLFIELIRGGLYRNFKVENYKMPFLIYIFNRFVSRYLSIGAVAYCIGLFEGHALLKTTLTWYWFLYGYVVWELAHFVYHYLGHKVRLFWCLHATHHAPEDMNLSVTYAHFFLEAPYADVIRTTICILLGVNPPLLFLIMFVDGTWGSFIHVGENLLKDGRLGFLNRILLTPSHHRVHHAKNPLYMDTNFCNLLPIWDKVFGTLQTEEKDLKIEYGISRPIKRGHFGDVYFGEFYALFHDIRRATGLKNKLLYVIMPPGWSHTGDHKTAKVVRHAYLQQATGEPVAPVS